MRKAPIRHRRREPTYCPWLPVAGFYGCGRLGCTDAVEKGQGARLRVGAAAPELPRCCPDRQGRRARLCLLDAAPLAVGLQPERAIVDVESLSPADGEREAGDVLSVPRSTGSYSCRQPAGRPIYVNLVSVVCDTLVPGEHPRFGTSDAQLQLCSKSYFTGAGTPSATVDGHAVNFKGLLVATGGFPPPRALWQPVRCSTSSVSQAAANAEPEPAARERDGKGPQRDEHAERFNCRAPETRKAPRGAFRQRSRLRATGSSGGRCRGRRSASPPCPSA